MAVHSAQAPLSLLPHNMGVPCAFCDEHWHPPGAWRVSCQYSGVRRLRRSHYLHAAPPLHAAADDTAGQFAAGNIDNPIPSWHCRHTTPSCHSSTPGGNSSDAAGSRSVGQSWTMLLNCCHPSICLHALLSGILFCGQQSMVPIACLHAVDTVRTLQRGEQSNSGRCEISSGLAEVICRRVPCAPLLHYRCGAGRAWRRLPRCCRQIVQFQAASFLATPAKYLPCKQIVEQGRAGVH